MTRPAEKVAVDVVRVFRRCLAAEEELQDAHAEGDFERAMRAAIVLKRGILVSRRLVEEHRRSTGAAG